MVFIFKTLTAFIFAFCLPHLHWLTLISQGRSSMKTGRNQNKLIKGNIKTIFNIKYVVV
jgi:hypothetical protein